MAALISWIALMMAHPLICSIKKNSSGSVGQCCGCRQSAGVWMFVWLVSMQRACFIALHVFLRKTNETVHQQIKMLTFKLDVL